MCLVNSDETNKRKPKSICSEGYRLKLISSAELTKRSLYYISNKVERKENEIFVSTSNSVYVGLIKSGPHRLIYLMLSHQGVHYLRTRRCGLIRVGVASLEEVCHGGRL